MVRLLRRPWLPIADTRLGHQPGIAACLQGGRPAAPRGTDTSMGVSTMGDELRSDSVRGMGEPGLGVQVCSDTQGSWVSLRGELDLVSAPISSGYSINYAGRVTRRSCSICPGWSSSVLPG